MADGNTFIRYGALNVCLKLTRLHLNIQISMFSCVGSDDDDLGFPPPF